MQDNSIGDDGPGRFDWTAQQLVPRIRHAECVDELSVATVSIGKLGCKSLEKPTQPAYEYQSTLP